jgi:anaerobic magnesium-protoporphyrin IX monomethyl ester cyclase
MRILVVNPPRVDGFVVVREERYEHKDVGALYPPLSLLYIAAVLEKEGHKPDFIDANGFNIPLEGLQATIDVLKPEVVITRCGFDTQEEDIRVLKYAKEKHGSITILRNKIISEAAFIKEDLLKKNPFIDIFLNCDPDVMIRDVIRHLQAHGLKDIDRIMGISYMLDGKMVTTPPAEPLANLDEIPFPAYHLLPSLKPYHTGVLDAPFATISTTRGCPFTCTFCAYRKTGYRMRSPENVIAELKQLKKMFGLKSFLFFDDVIGLKPGRFEKICELIIAEKLDLKWVACTRVNLVNLEQLKLMKKAGCQELAFGIESGDEGVLRDTTKGVTLDEIRTAARLCRKAGILFYGMAIIGLPGESRKSIENTIKFIKEIRPFYTQFCFSTPFPNTEVYHYYEENGLLLSKNWKEYSPLSPVPVIRTKDLTREELVELRNIVYRRIVLDPVYLLSQVRLFDWKWNIQGFIKILSRIKAILMKKFVR